MTREDIAMHAVALHTGEVVGSIPTAPTSLRCFAAPRQGVPKHAKGARRRRRPRSGQVHREAFEIGERAVAQSAFVRSAQNHAGCLARLEGFLPSRCAKTPTVA